MRKVAFYTLLTFLFFSPLLTRVPLSEAIKKGIKLSFQYQNNLIDSEYIKLSREIKKKDKLFHINLAATYLYKSETMELDPGLMLPPSIPAQSTLPIQVGTRHTIDAKIGLFAPIYRGNILTNNVKSENFKHSITQNNKHFAKIRIASSIKNSYFKYKLINNRINSLRLLRENLEVHYNRIHSLYREELVNKTSLLETKAKIEEQNLVLFDLKEELNRESVIFKFLCGLDIKDIEESYSEPVDNMDTALTFLKNHHPLLKNLTQRINLFNLQKDIIKGNYLPQITGFAELHYGKPGINMFKDEWSLYFQGGINLKLKLFDWNKKSQALELLSYSIDKILNEKLDFIQDAKKQLSLLYNRRESYRKKLKSISSLIKIAQEETSLKKRMVLEEQISNPRYLSALLKRDRYLSMQSSILTSLELIKININSLIGRSREAK